MDAYISESGEVYHDFGNVQATVNHVKEAITWLEATEGSKSAFTQAMDKLQNPLADWARGNSYQGLKTSNSSTIPSKPQIADYLRRRLLPGPRAVRKVPEDKVDQTEDTSSSLATPVTCFLSSAASDRETADDVRSVLTELGVDVQTADDLQPGSDIGVSIVDAVLSAAFVCIVLSDAPPLPAIMFEAGIATGSRRPVLIVASPQGANQLPADILSAPIIRYRKGSTDLLRSSLNAYLKNVQPIAVQLTLNWDVLIEEQGQARDDLKVSREESSIGRIANHLQQIGALVAVDGRIGRGRVDVIATIPTLGESFNPVLIEVKQYASRIESDLQQMRLYLRDANARIGLIIYGKDAPSHTVRTTGSMGILLLSADELMSWDGNRLIREITKLRNQVVHSA